MACSEPGRQRLSSSVLIFLIFAGCSSIPTPREHELASVSSLSQAGSPKTAFQSAVDSILCDTLFPPANVGMMVVSLRDRSVLYERHARMLFTPASNQKLFTSCAVLALLGPYYRVSTSVTVDDARNRIYLRGGGDPIVSTDDLDSLAAALLPRLPGGRTWTIVGDPSLFDDVPWGNGWMWDDAADPDGMGVSALSVNGNAVSVFVRGGATPGSETVCAIVPSTPSLVLRNTSTTVDSIRVPLRIARALQSPGNTLTVEGQILPGRIRHERVAISHPEQFATELFTASLQRLGVVGVSTAIDTLPATLQRSATRSRRMDSVIVAMNKTSDNLAAECLVKLLGAVFSGGRGTWPGGLDAVRRYVASAGIDTARIIIADGSGVSRYNLASAETVVKLLVAAHGDQRIFPTLYTSLPIAGEDGTLSHRMRGTPAEHYLRAKTGTIAGVSSLSGYVPTVGGDTLAFSIMMENFVSEPTDYRRAQDALGTLMRTWVP